MWHISLARPTEVCCCHSTKQDVFIYNISNIKIMQNWCALVHNTKNYM